jgi:chaperone modulatory protein CbpM
MKIEHTEVVWVEAHATYGIDDAAMLSGLSSELLRFLVECEALPGVRSSVGDPVFESASLTIARAARRLRDAFELENQGLAVAVSLLRRIEALEAELVRLKAEAPGAASR